MGGWVSAQKVFTFGRTCIQRCRASSTLSKRCRDSASIQRLHRVGAEARVVGHTLPGAALFTSATVVLCGETKYSIRAEFETC